MILPLVSATATNISIFHELFSFPAALMNHVMIHCDIIIPESQMLPSQKPRLRAAVQWKSPWLRRHLLRSIST